MTPEQEAFVRDNIDSMTLHAMARAVKMDPRLLVHHLRGKNLKIGIAYQRSTYPTPDGPAIKALAERFG